MTINPVNRSRIFRGIVLLMAGALLASAAPDRVHAQAAADGAAAVRLKEIATVEGVRHNQLVGFGLVTGLDGQGDSSRSDLVKQLLANSLASFDVDIEAEKIESRNSAVVMVTAETPSFVRPGQKIDVTVSSVQDARNLQGGQLLQTPLKGANGTVYAVAQGGIDVRVREDEEGNRTVGRIVDGALVEREIVSRYEGGRSFSLVLQRPDFVTASAAADALREALDGAEVTPLDAGKIRVDLAQDDGRSLVEVIAAAEQVTIQPGRSGRVVINASSGVVVAGSEVRIAPVTVTYEEAELSIGSYSMAGDSGSGGAVRLDATTRVADLVSVLKEAGLGIDDIIEIMKTIERAGALYGTLDVM
jgi:flagellar P-ring protein precursor FlgI